MKVRKRFMAIFSRWLVLVLTVSVVFAACSKEETIEQEDSDDHGESVVQLSAEQLKEFEIEIGTAEPGNIQVQRKLSGEIIVEPDRLAHVIPRFPGIVKEVRKHPGRVR